MKKTRILVLFICAALLVAVTATGTLAYLKDRDTVVNTFTVGRVFIELDETKVTPDGVPVEGAGRVKENEYHLVPGRTYVKDPTVTVAEGSERAYVRMLVTVNCYNELTGIFGDPFLPQCFVGGWDESVWVSTGAIEVDSAAGTATYEFRYKQVVSPLADADLTLEPLFQTITVPGEMTGEELAAIASFEVTVVGHAIQADGFDDAESAWAAFDAESDTGN